VKEEGDEQEEEKYYFVDFSTLIAEQFRRYIFLLSVFWLCLLQRPDRRSSIGR